MPSISVATADYQAQVDLAIASSFSALKIDDDVDELAFHWVAEKYDTRVYHTTIGRLLHNRLWYESPTSSSWCVGFQPQIFFYRQHTQNKNT